MGVSCKFCNSEDVRVIYSYSEDEEYTEYICRNCGESWKDYIYKKEWHTAIPKRSVRDGFSC